MYIGIETGISMKKILCALYEIFIFLPLFVLATIITATTVIIGGLIGNSKFWGYYPPRYWSKFACRLALCRIKVVRKGTLDPNQSYVFVPNHQSYSDIFLIYGYLNHNIKWVQKHELRKIPFVGKACEIAGHIYVNHSSYRSMRETIAKAKSQLSNGASIVMFPEGARTMTGKMDKFRRGAFIIAQEMGLPVVPVTENGAFDVMRRGSLLLVPGKLELIIHDPIPTENITEDEIPELMDKCREIIHSSLWDKYK